MPTPNTCWLVELPRNNTHYPLWLANCENRLFTIKMQPLISLKILDYLNFACAEIPVHQKHVNTLSVIIPDDIAALVIEYKSGRDIGDAFHLYLLQKEMIKTQQKPVWHCYPFKAGIFVNIWHVGCVFCGVSTDIPPKYAQ